MRPDEVFLKPSFHVIATIAQEYVQPVTRRSYCYRERYYDHWDWLDTILGDRTVAIIWKPGLNLSTNHFDDVMTDDSNEHGSFRPATWSGWSNNFIVNVKFQNHQ